MMDSYLLGYFLKMFCWREKKRQGGLRACPETKQERATTDLDDHDGLLNDVVDLGLDQVKENLNAAVGGPLDLDGANANGTD